MDDFTKKNKYSSLHSAIRDVVSQNRNLHQENTNAKYGIQTEQPVEQTEVNEEVEQIDEAKMIAIQVIDPDKMIKDLKSARIPAKKMSDDEIGIDKKYAEAAITWMVRKGGFDYRDIKDNYPELVKASM